MLHSIRLAHAVARHVGWLQRLVVNFETRLTQTLSLFDRDHYLTQVSPQELKGLSALKHYVAVGDALGLSPSPLFDPEYIDTHWGAEAPSINRMLYYGLAARRRKLTPSPWFDRDYYLSCNPDVAKSGMDPLAHFLRYGVSEHRSPVAGVDLRRIAAENPALRVAKRRTQLLQLLVAGKLTQGHPTLARHASEDGQAEPAPQEFDDAPGAAFDLLDPDSWSQLTPRGAVDCATVDVLVPVYAGAHETLRCLWSVLTAPVTTAFELVVINDAGPDAQLNGVLRTLAQRNLFAFQQHRHNLGFVKTVNEGLRRHRDRDVIILNADTEVYGDWLDRMLAMAGANPQLGSITPLSNNATICSYPDGVGERALRLEVSHRQLDALAARTNPGAFVTAPTGVGFCMFMRRKAIREVGLFDEKAFGRGYGEENDWCQRALARGWHHAIAADVYVRHVGSVSFKSEARARIQAAMRTLAKRHPRYHSDVKAFISANPLWTHRARIDLARLQAASGERNVLLVCHSRGGGTERHLLEQMTQLVAEGASVFELRPSHQPDCVSLQHTGVYGLENVAAMPIADQAWLDEVFISLRIHEVHVHHLVDFPSHTSQALQSVCRRLGLALRLVVHDYFLMCPRINLVTSEQGRHCGNPTEADCDRCLRADGLARRTGTIAEWRAESLDLMKQAAQVIVPSSDVAHRLGRMAPLVPFRIEPHEAAPPAPAHPLPHATAGAAVHVLVVGAISWVKGFGVVHGLARAMREHQLPLRLSLLGHSMDDTALREQHVNVLGRYYDHELAERLTQISPDLILIPSIWPETYCYVLTGAMRAGRRIAVFDLGAQAERTRLHHPDHLILPIELADEPALLSRRLIDGARAPSSLQLPASSANRQAEP